MRLNCRGLLLVLLLATAIALPPYLGTYYTRFATQIAIYGMAALSIDLLLGYTGLITFGQAALFGIGTYAAGMLTVRVTRLVPNILKAQVTVHTHARRTVKATLRLDGGAATAVEAAAGARRSSFSNRTAGAALLHAAPAACTWPLMTLPAPGGRA